MASRRTLLLIERRHLSKRTGRAPKELIGVTKYTEEHEFHCEPCRYDWRVRYEVRDREDAEGLGVAYFYQDGIPASPPQQGRRCPNCWVATTGSHLVDGELALKR
jgi:hypothetical protein